MVPVVEVVSVTTPVDRVAVSVTSGRWAIVHVVACAMSFFGVIGMAGLYAKQAKQTRWLGLVGFVLLSLWFVLIMVPILGGAEKNGGDSSPSASFRGRMTC